MQISHFHTNCKELQPALRFFTEGLKGTVVKTYTMGGHPAADISFEGGLLISLKENGSEWNNAEPLGNFCGYNHIGFEAEDLDKTIEEILKIPGTRLDGDIVRIPDRKRCCAFVIGPSDLYVEFGADMKD